MMLSAVNYRNPRATAGAAIECEIEHPVFGWIPFVASPTDPEAHGRQIHARILADAVPLAPWRPDTTVTGADVDRECARRLRGTATFRAHAFQADQLSLIRIAGAGSLAAAALAAGAQPGDYRWHGGADDFVWFSADNAAVPLDAQAMFAFAQAMAIREGDFVRAARALKGTAPIPADYTDNRYWPA
ncbi:hypothetical protein [Albidovulum sp.]|uniref:DUF4376 domain-containing protein n=1 Tax=Albidovulum sp. TaxID=1872424 RepID=UPI0039B85FE2